MAEAAGVAAVRGDGAPLWVGWCREGKGPWAALCRAATEKECWQLLLDRAARVQFAKVCVLREGERP